MTILGAPQTKATGSQVGGLAILASSDYGSEKGGSGGDDLYAIQHRVSDLISDPGKFHIIRGQKIYGSSTVTEHLPHEPLKLDPIRAFIDHLSNMSKLSRSWFNSPAELFGAVQVGLDLAGRRAVVPGLSAMRNLAGICLKCSHGR
jgi:hypothetical protein